MFDVGDEVVCVDDSPFYGHATQIRKGVVFKVCAVFRQGDILGNVTFLDDDWISVGVQNDGIRVSAERHGLVGLPHFDFWPSIRFRKVERKRSREELYALIGIHLDQMGGARVPEVACLPYPEPVVRPMCRCVPMPCGSEAA